MEYHYKIKNINIQSSMVSCNSYLTSYSFNMIFLRYGFLGATCRRDRSFSRRGRRRYTASVAVLRDTSPRLITETVENVQVFRLNMASTLVFSAFEDEILINFWLGFTKKWVIGSFYLSTYQKKKSQVWHSLIFAYWLFIFQIIP